MSHQSDFNELLEEYGKLMERAGRISAQIEHHYRMSSVIRDTTPDPKLRSRSRQVSNSDVPERIKKLLEARGPLSSKIIIKELKSVEPVYIRQVLSRLSKDGIFDHIGRTYSLPSNGHTSEISS